MGTIERYDVAVVGAGLAGLQCARLLGQAGLRVLLLDRKETLSQSIHTTGIFVRRTLEDFDLPPACLGPPVRRVVLYSPARRALTLESPQDEFRVGRMGALYLQYLAECERAAVVWSPATRLVRSERAADGSTLFLLTGNRPWEVQTRFVVGADGAQSATARSLGLDTNREWITGVEDVLREVPLEGPPSFFCFLDSTLAPGYIAWVVHDGEETHVGVGGYSARYQPLRALERFRDEIGRKLNLERGTLVERRGGRIPVGGVLKRIANDRGLLVGDAAGAPSPLTAGGLDACMRLSRLAAHVIARFLAGDPRALAEYSGRALRRRFVLRRILRRVMAGVTSPPLLEFAHGLLRVTPLRGIAQQVFFGRGSFPDVELAANETAVKRCR